MQKHSSQINQTTLLCGDSSHCPKVIVNPKRVFITDDFGGKVRLTKEEFDILKTKIIKGQL